MKQVEISLEVDARTKKEFEEICDREGLSFSQAMNLYIEKVIRERAIPFKLSLKPEQERDPFYAPENIAYLKDIYEKFKRGEAKIVEHELIN